MTTRPITKLLVANRAEIACRIIRTANEMRIPTVAVYSDSDAGARHVRLADEAVRLPGNTAADTYLRVDVLLDAARRTGADAVHPGYGFLSEHAEFARACIDAGLTFVGPPPDAIAAMGNKVEAKARMTEAGVPVLPGVTLDDGIRDDALAAAGAQVGYPVLVKAAFGGGGRGMRVVGEPAQLADAVESARREAAAAFGDGLVFLERYVTNPRHIEVQVFADTQGHTVHLFERECSIQRRHQKVIEETPSVAVDEALRARLGDAAVTAARAIGYVGAGTVEFVMAPNGEFFFLEVNTRLQVEHPVTEMITGLDLVRLQLEVAGGAPLPPEALEPARNGHAIEARLVAEDVPAGFLPTSGRFHRLSFGGVAVGQSVTRVDSGYDSGDTVSTFYDALLAKVIAWARTRDEAIGALSGALRRATLHGPSTNRDLLVRTLEHPEFIAGAIDTGFYERHDPSELGRASLEPDVLDRLAIAAALAAASAHMPALAVPFGWRNTAPGWVSTAFGGDTNCTVSLRQARDGGWQARVGDDATVHNVALEPNVDRDRQMFRIDGVTMLVSVDRVAGETWIDSEHGHAHLVDVSRFPPSEAAADAGSLHSPLPGTVVRVDVAVGDTVQAGAALVVLEAMKMEHTIRAPHDGVVSELDVAVGTQVETGAVLVVVDEVDKADGAGQQLMAVSVAELLADLGAETAVFDRWIATLPDAAWAQPTPAAGWTIADQVSHLAYFDDAAVLSATDPDAFRAGLDAVAGDVDGFTARIAAEHRSKSPDELRAWFGRARANLGATYAAIDPRARLPWYGPDMSAASMVTARIMETWAHGQDVADTLDVAHPATAAVRHVAYLGVRTRDFSYTVRGLDPPGADVHVELTGPHGEVWTFGGDDASDVVRGPAVDFCLVVTQRRHLDDTALDVQGAHAARWMAIAQAYAGPPGRGRASHAV